MTEYFFILMAGFTIGIMGSFHCVGMCGPLALSLPIHQYSTIHKWIAMILYNIGRVVSYMTIGIVFGIIGQSFSFFKIQQILSISIGGLILLGLYLFHFKRLKTYGLSHFANRIKNNLSSLLISNKTPGNYFKIGLTNGFLPCGLVYLAVATAIASGSIFRSALVMLGFGIGTIPVMLLTMSFGQFLSLNIRQQLNKVTPYFIFFTAVLLILRGMNLGIPYISPSLIQNHLSCCHK